MKRKKRKEGRWKARQRRSRRWNENIRNKWREKRGSERHGDWERGRREPGRERVREAKRRQMIFTSPRIRPKISSLPGFNDMAKCSAALMEAVLCLNYSLWGDWVSFLSLPAPIIRQAVQRMGWKCWDTFSFYVLLFFFVLLLSFSLSIFLVDVFHE